MKTGKIISEKIKELINKLIYKIQKVILYLYPEIKNLTDGKTRENFTK